MVNGEKMSKSKGNFYRLDDIVEKGFDPMDLRYACLLTHYRKTLNFTWEALKAAREARIRLSDQLSKYTSTGDAGERTMLSPEKLAKNDMFRRTFTDALFNDMNTPQAVSVVWDVLKSNIPSEDKYDLVVSFDEVLGLGIANSKQSTANSTMNVVPEQIQELVKKRETLRGEQKWADADNIRDQIKEQGYAVNDAGGETVVTKIKN